MGFPVSSNIPVTILDEQGQAVPHRNNVKIVNANITDDLANDATVVSINQGGLLIGDVTNLAAEKVARVLKVTLTWEDPDDIIIDGITQVAWGGTKIVRKIGSAPVSVEDGTVIVNNTVRDQYSSTGFEDTSNIALDTQYYYRAFPYSTNGAYSTGSYIDVIVPSYMIFGAEWTKGTATAWTRTDDAANFTDPVIAVNDGEGSSPFDAYSPWKDITTENINGDQSRLRGTFVKIPKFYYKWTKGSGTIKLQISDSALEGYHVSPAHMDRGDGKGERDWVYVGKYVNTNSGSYATIKETGTISQQRTNLIKNIQGVGQFSIMDYATFLTVAMLYLVEFADWNANDKIPMPNAYLANADTADMSYHTGVLKNTSDKVVETQYRYIQGITYADGTFLDGFYNTGGMNDNFLLVKNPADFASGNNAITTDLTFTNVSAQSAYNKLIKDYDFSAIQGCEFLMLPSDYQVYNSNATAPFEYVASEVYCYASNVFPRYIVRHSQNNNNQVVLFNMFSLVNNISNINSGDVKARLMLLT